MLDWRTSKLSLTVPEFCRMKFRTVWEPGSTFLLIAGSREALRATKLTILDSMVTDVVETPAIKMLPPQCVISL